MKQPHICLDETLGVRYAILPGDPARLDRVAAQLESVRELAYNREFRSLTGTYKGVPVLAVSTGIGGSSAGIQHSDRRPERRLNDIQLGIDLNPDCLKGSFCRMMPAIPCACRDRFLYNLNQFPCGSDRSLLPVTQDG